MIRSARIFLVCSMHAVAVLAMLGPSPRAAADVPAPCADRTAIERVYHEHRTGTRKPFEETMPPAQIERLVKNDLRKEAVLKAVYQVEITPALVAAEVRRIEATTRAPEILAEIKAALGNDPVRFAQSMARPIVVDRMLRARFDNDDVLHAPQRREAEAARDKLKAGQTVPDLRDDVWQLTPRPAEDAPAPQAVPAATKASTAGGIYTNEATANLAQSLTPVAPADKDRKHYLEDLPADLQRVIKAQLNQPGDVSAVIEMPDGFLVFRCIARDAATLKTSCLTIHKRGYNEWLAQQPKIQP